MGEVVQELVVKRDPSSPAADVRAACGALVQEAYKRGILENLTIVLVRFEWEGVEDEAFSMEVDDNDDAKESGKAAVASKRKRLATAANVSAQRFAAHERAVAADEADAQKVEDAQRAVE